MERYYKNFILCGEVNYYCVLCQEIFNDLSSVEKHLKWPDHRNHIKNQDYVAKFRNNFIYKIIDDRYYCEICNLVFKNAKVHIKDNVHQYLKTSKTFAKQRRSNVQYIDKRAIQISNEKITVAKWQGLNDDMCLLCDEKFGTVTCHIKSFDHVVNLIQSETISENVNHYRKQGENSFYCFTCFKVYNKDTLDAHWTECHQNIQKIREEKENRENMKKTLTKRKHKSSNVILNRKNKYFDFDTFSKRVSFKYNEIIDLDNARKSHLRRVNIQRYFDCERPLIDMGKKRAEVANYGRNNFLTLNRRGSKSYCSLCCMYIDANINVVKEHVEGAIHMGHLELGGLIKKQNRPIFPVHLIPHKTFIKQISGPTKVNGLKTFLINESIPVIYFSYWLISIDYNFRQDIVKCYGCNISVNLADVPIHLKSEEHMNNIINCNVVLYSEQYGYEYVREIRSNLYHCGYCNKVYPFLENLKKHLKSTLHMKMRLGAAKLYTCMVQSLYGRGL